MSATDETPAPRSFDIHMHDYGPRELPPPRKYDVDHCPDVAERVRWLQKFKKRQPPVDASTQETE